MDSPQKPRICISLCESTVPALERAIADADAVCDLIEVRLDCLEPRDLEAERSSITTLLTRASCGSILTFRPAQQGGLRRLDDDTRHAFWSAAIFSESFFDVELDLAEKLQAHQTTSYLAIDWRRTICSYHDFEGTPAQIGQIYERMAATPARILKIAVWANDATDCLAVFQLLERARSDGREMIALAMGPAGIATRVLGPARGSFLTYASRNNESTTAPGQLSARELREVYRIEKIDQNTKIFGIAGLPVSHSVSPQMHNAALATTQMNAVYLPFEVRNLQTFVKRMIHPRTREISWNLRGLSITAPHKVAVMNMLDWIEPSAMEVGAVNTVVVEDSRLHGYNTDISGFIEPLLQVLGDVRDSRCAVIGAGGAAHAALWSLRKAGAATSIFSRYPAKSEAAADRFGAESRPLEAAQFNSFDVVVNATPLGTAGAFENETPVSASQLRGARLAYDLVYNPSETRFLREAREVGCQTLGGLAMLVAQAGAQFQLWTGAPPPQQLMYEAAARGLEKTP